MTLMQQALGEFFGVLLLMYIGDGVVANHLLDKNNAKGLGVFAIDAAWGAAVALPAFIFMDISGAYLNPAVTFATMLRGLLPIQTGIIFILSQIAGAFVGSFLVYLTFLDQFKMTEDKGIKLNCFTTRPAVKHLPVNFLSELIGTTFLVYFVFELTSTDLSNLAKANMIGMLVFGLAVCMGGCTGASLNPARDLGPRLAHTILPVHEKGSSEWDYGWVPPVAQFCASFVAVGIHTVVHFH